MTLIGSSLALKDWDMTARELFTIAMAGTAGGFFLVAGVPSVIQH